MSRQPFRAATVAAALTAVVLTAAPVLAHEHRTVGGYTFIVGWKDEPSFSGTRNAVQLFLSDGAGQPVTDLGDTLSVTPVFGSQKGDTAAMHAAFGKTYGTPGEYNSSLIPTRPGTYAFHFTGSIKGQNVDETFTSSDHTFNNVENPATVEFPAKDPSTGELAAKLSNLDPRLQAMQAAEASARHRASTATTLGIVGIVLGALALLVGAAAVRSAARRAGASERTGAAVSQGAS